MVTNQSTYHRPSTVYRREERAKSLLFYEFFNIFLRIFNFSLILWSNTMVAQSLFLLVSTKENNVGIGGIAALVTMLL